MFYTALQVQHTLHLTTESRGYSYWDRLKLRRARLGGEFNATSWLGIFGEMDVSSPQPNDDPLTFYNSPNDEEEIERQNIRPSLSRFGIVVSPISSLSVKFGRDRVPIWREGMTFFGDLPFIERSRSTRTLHIMNLGGNRPSAEMSIVANNQLKATLNISYTKKFDELSSNRETYFVRNRNLPNLFVLRIENSIEKAASFGVSMAYSAVGNTYRGVDKADGSMQLIAADMQTTLHENRFRRCSMVGGIGLVHIGKSYASFYNVLRFVWVGQWTVQWVQNAGSSRFTHFAAGVSYCRPDLHRYGTHPGEWEYGEYPYFRQKQTISLRAGFGIRLAPHLRFMLDYEQEHLERDGKVRIVPFVKTQISFFLKKSMF